MSPRADIPLAHTEDRTCSPDAFRRFFEEHRKEQRGDWSDASLARLVIDFFAAHDAPLIRVHGTFWVFDPRRGLFRERQSSAFEMLLFALSDQCPRCNKTSNVRAAVAAVSALVNQEPSYFGDAPNVLVCANGVFSRPVSAVVAEAHSTCGAEFIRFDQNGFAPEHRQCFGVPVGYDEHADTSLIDSFLAGCFDDNLTAQLVFDVWGGGLFGLGRELQRIVVLHGDGANGKGVLLSLIQMLGPGLCCSVPLENMSKEYLRTPLATARFNLVGELPGRLPPGTINVLKSLTGGDIVSFRSISKDVFNTISPSVQIFASNPRMSFEHVNEAIRRRLIVIRFPRIVPPDQRRPRLAQELFAQGAAGIFRRVVEGARRVEQRMATGQEPLLLPPSVQQASEGWLQETDVVAEFAASRLVLTGDPRHQVTAAEMHAAFREHVGAEGPVLGFRELKSRLERLGLTHCHSNGSKWSGVQWR